MLERGLPLPGATRRALGMRQVSSAAHGPDPRLEAEESAVDEGTILHASRALKLIRLGRLAASPAKRLRASAACSRAARGPELEGCGSSAKRAWPSARAT